MDAAPRHAASSIDPKAPGPRGQGDQQAFGQLYDQSSTLLFTLAYRILSNRDEAAELLQDVPRSLEKLPSTCGARQSHRLAGHPDP